MHVALIMAGGSKSKSKAPASSASGTTVPRSATPSSAEILTPEVVTVFTIPNTDVFSSAPPSNTNHPSVMVSGSGGGGDCPPSHSGDQCSGAAQLSGQVHHSLKRSLESEDLPGLFEHKRFVMLKSMRRLLPLLVWRLRCPSARRLPFSPAVREVIVPLFTAPDFGINRRLVPPSLTGTREGEERSLRSLSRAPVESQSLSINSSGMLNQTGQVDRYTLPSLPLPSCSSVPGSRVVACPLSPSPSHYEGPVPAYVSDFALPFQEEVFEVEDAEWDEPCSDISPHKMGRSRARDPILDCALTGLEAEAMIKKYGGDLHGPEEPAPLASTTHSAGLFCVSLPNPGMNLAPDFVREYDRVASSDFDRRSARVVADNFRFSKESSEKYLTQKRPRRN